MSYYRDQLENWLSTIDVKHPRVLDIGGKEKPVKGRTKSWEVQHYDILDLPDYDLNLENQSFMKYRQYACVIFCLEVMEYIYNPVQAIKNLYSMLRTSGELYISFPFVYPEHNPREIDYLRYTESGIRKLFEIAGFKILEIKPRMAKSTAQLKQFYIAEGMHVASNSGVIGWLIHAKR